MNNEIKTKEPNPNDWCAIVSLDEETKTVYGWYKNRVYEYKKAKQVYEALANKGNYKIYLITKMLKVEEL